MPPAPSSGLTWVPASLAASSDSLLATAFPSVSIQKELERPLGSEALLSKSTARPTPSSVPRTHMCAHVTSARGRQRQAGPGAHSPV